MATFHMFLPLLLIGISLAILCLTLVITSFQEGVQVGDIVWRRADHNDALQQTPDAWHVDTVKFIVAAHSDSPLRVQALRSILEILPERADVTVVQSGTLPITPSLVNSLRMTTLTCENKVLQADFGKYLHALDHLSLAGYKLVCFMNDSCFYLHPVMDFLEWIHRDGYRTHLYGYVQSLVVSPHAQSMFRAMNRDGCQRFHQHMKEHLHQISSRWQLILDFEVHPPCFETRACFHLAKDHTDRHFISSHIQHDLNHGYTMLKLKTLYNTHVAMDATDVVPERYFYPDVYRAMNPQVRHLNPQEAWHHYQSWGYYDGLVAHEHGMLQWLRPYLREHNLYQHCGPMIRGNLEHVDALPVTLVYAAHVAEDTDIQTILHNLEYVFHYSVRTVHLHLIVTTQQDAVEQHLVDWLPRLQSYHYYADETHTHTRGFQHLHRVAQSANVATIAYTPATSCDESTKLLWRSILDQDRTILYRQQYDVTCAWAARQHPWMHFFWIHVQVLLEHIRPASWDDTEDPQTYLWTHHQKKEQGHYVRILSLYSSKPLVEKEAHAALAQHTQWEASSCLT